MKQILLCILLCWCTAGFAQPEDTEYKKTWSVQAGFGQLTFADNRVTGDNTSWGDSRANLFYVNADWFLTPRLALVGGVYWEQDGIMTEMASGIGIKKYSQFGVQTGGKFYFFPKRWFVQPHVGALLITNFGQLKHSRGGFNVGHIVGYPNNSGIFKYDLQCPAFSIAPHIGVDLHLFPSLSFTFDYDYRIGWWGQSRSELFITQGTLGGSHFFDERKPYRGGFSFGLKLDFPIKATSEKNGRIVRNLLDYILFMLQ